MPALTPTRFQATITWLGLVEDRAARLESASRSVLELDYAGPKGEAHGGLTRPACSRVSALYPKGTEIRNTRQLSVLSAEEMAAIAAAMGLTALDPALLGANLVLEGLPDLSFLPPSARLQAEDGATLVIDMNNRPCRYPGEAIEAAHPGFGAAFKEAAKGRRGVTAWVERPGRLVLGGKLRLFVPDQRPWEGLAGSMAQA